MLSVSEAGARSFDLAFVPMQVFTFFHVRILHAMATRVVMTMHDLISLRCNELDEDERHLSMQAAMRSMDGVITVSRSVADDFDACKDDLLGSHPAPPIAPILHGFPAASPWARETSLPFDLSRPFVFLVGNHFRHKALQRALECIPPGVRVVMLGGEEQRHARAGVLPPAAGFLRGAQPRFPPTPQARARIALRLAPLNRHHAVRIPAHRRRS